MIGFLEGKVVSKNLDNNSILLLCGPIGYEILVPKNFLDFLQSEQPLQVWTHTHVREDILALYGFPTEKEKQSFKLLLSVSGLGPKTAMSLLSEHGPKLLFQYIIQKDSDAISKASGVGKKLAQKIILELASKLEKFSWIDQMEQRQLHSDSGSSEKSSMRDDLVSALIHLGYSPNPVKLMVDNILEENEAMNFDLVLKLALKNLSSRHL